MNAPGSTETERTSEDRMPLVVRPELEMRGLQEVHATRTPSQLPTPEQQDKVPWLLPRIQQEMLAEAGHGTGHIVVIGAVLTRFFSEMNARFLKELAGVLAKPKNWTQFTVLLLDPSSPEGERRAKLEGNAHADDIIRTQDAFWQHFGGLDNCRLGLYSSRPSAYVVITSNFACEQRYTIAPSTTGRCFCEDRPTLVFRPNSEYYRSLREEVSILLGFNGAAEVFREKIDWVSGSAPVTEWADSGLVAHSVPAAPFTDRRIRRRLDVVLKRPAGLMVLVVTFALLRWLSSGEGKVGTFLRAFSAFIFP